MIKSFLKAIANAISSLAARIASIFKKAGKQGNPDENPKRRYDTNFKLTGYFNDKDSKVAGPEYDRLQKEEGDGNTIVSYNTDKDMQCKMGLCHDPGTEIIERPGWEDENRTIASRQGPLLSYDERKAWYDSEKAKYNNGQS